MIELPPITNLEENVPVKKICHARDTIWVVAYINGLIQLIDFNNPDAQEPLASYQIQSADFINANGSEDQLNEFSEKLNILMDIDI